MAGLGPGPLSLLQSSLMDRAALAPAVLLRTQRHPAAEPFAGYESLDALYEQASSFEQLYPEVVEAIVQAAQKAGELLYIVPGSPLVAEHTVALLRGDARIQLEIIPAISFLDLVWERLGVDPVDQGVRLIDATDFAASPAGPGPVLCTQAWSPQLLSEIKLSLDELSSREAPRAVILHHLGLEDELILDVALDELDRAMVPDHLTSVWLPVVATPGQAVDALVALMAQLRERCPWDAEQSHGSLARHLIEEAYEVVEVLDLIADGTGSDHEMLWLEEELGDLLFQIVFHAHLASEVGAFNLSGVASHVEAKLIARHPHVFAGEELAEDGAVGQWERIKQAEKQRESVTDGIAPGLPALSLIAKLRSKAAAIGMEQATVHSAMGELQKAISALEVEAGEAQIAALLSAVAQYSAASACDAEAVLRKLASSLRTEILNFEAGAKP